jgi:hypothetical protein
MLQYGDRFLVIQDVAFAIFEHSQDCCFDITHHFVVLILGQDEFLVLGIQHFVLFPHDQIQELLLQTFKGDHEVDYADFGRHLWQEVRVGVARSHVKPEFVRIVNRAITEFDLLLASSLEDLLEQDWIKDRIEVFSAAFQKQGQTHSHGLLESLSEVSV